MDSALLLAPEATPEHCHLGLGRRKCRLGTAWWGWRSETQYTLLAKGEGKLKPLVALEGRILLFSLWRKLLSYLKMGIVGFLFF